MEAHQTSGGCELGALHERRGTGVFIPLRSTSRLPGKSVSFSVHAAADQGLPAPAPLRRHHAPIKSKSFGPTTSLAGPSNTSASQLPAAASGEFWQQLAAGADQQLPQHLPAHAIAPAGGLWRANSSPLPRAGWQDEQEAAAAAAAAATTSWCASLAGSAQQWAAAAATGSTTGSSADYEGCWALDEDLACRSSSSSSQTFSHANVVGRMSLLREAAYFRPAAAAGIAPAAAMACSMSAPLQGLNVAGQPMGSLQSLSAPLPALVPADGTADATVELINQELERLLALRQQLTAGRSLHRCPGSSRDSLDNRTLAAMAAGDGGFSPLAALADQQQQLALEQAREKLQQLQLMQQLQAQLEVELLQLLPICS